MIQADPDIDKLILILDETVLLSYTIVNVEIFTAATVPLPIPYNILPINEITKNQVD